MTEAEQTERENTITTLKKIIAEFPENWENNPTYLRSWLTKVTMLTNFIIHCD